ncbi:peptidylprolyl isomerase [Motiliproteus coralliicola]|uniref:Peptidyl-prolyl cis-trans isomerase n=1 Tax=Motiliproteus coralliicola TaxID=2283196 RepID=A0A369WCS1_9GAMM|nr:peptidylprolyl isomerase [Motiliproteus coralliicola]RDE18494.1 peptidylprolyl isomerase [Motiliproteus coralliicola]
MSAVTVGPGTRVSLHFTIEMEDGQVVDSTREKSPASFEFGDGNLLPGFEKALEGLSAKEQARLRIAPEQGFGMPNPNNVQRFSVNDFNEMELEPGLMISFADPSGELPGVVQSIEGDKVMVDFNHPLAGRMLFFDVEILSVELI